MKIYLLKTCARTVRKSAIAVENMIEAVVRAERGLIDADLGGGLIKQRIARKGEGRSGGHRMLIAFRKNHRAVFLFGFAKNAKGNIEADELEAAKTVATGWLGLTQKQIDQAIEDQQLIEVKNDDESSVPAPV